MLSHENRWKNALFIANNVILRFFFAQTQHFQKFIKPTKKFFWQKQKCLTILNDIDEPSSNFFKSLRQ
jgi:hypothetical protein